METDEVYFSNNTFSKPEGSVLIVQVVVVMIMVQRWRNPERDDGKSLMTSEHLRSVVNTSCQREKCYICSVFNNISLEPIIRTPPTISIATTWNSWNWKLKVSQQSPHQSVAICGVLLEVVQNLCHYKRQRTSAKSFGLILHAPREHNNRNQAENLFKGGKFSISASKRFRQRRQRQRWEWR